MNFYTVLEKDNGGKLRNRTFSYTYVYLFDLEKVVGRFKKDVSKRSKLGGARARSTSALTK